MKSCLGLISVLLAVCRTGPALVGDAAPAALKKWPTKPLRMILFRYASIMKSGKYSKLLNPDSHVEAQFVAFDDPGQAFRLAFQYSSSGPKASHCIKKIVSVGLG